jgi:hypothetical protein
VIWGATGLKKGCADVDLIGFRVTDRNNFGRFASGGRRAAVFTHQVGRARITSDSDPAASSRRRNLSLGSLHRGVRARQRQTRSGDRRRD